MITMSDGADAWRNKVMNYVRRAQSFGC